MRDRASFDLLERLAETERYSIWIYRDREAPFPLPDGFFDSAAALMREGDMVLAYLGPWPFGQISISLIDSVSRDDRVTFEDLSSTRTRSTQHGTAA